jgi:hypothetical protein
MKARSVVLGLALCFLGAAIAFAQAPQMGTWKLNEAKSKLAAGAVKNHTVKYEAAGESIKVTVDGTAADGKTVHSEWTGKFDGKDYPVTGDSTTDARSYKKINDNTLKLTTKLAGKTVATGTITVSPDGKTRTVTTTTTDSSGKKEKSTAVYDKEG